MTINWSNCSGRKLSYFLKSLRFSHIQTLLFRKQIQGNKRVDVFLTSKIFNIVLFQYFKIQTNKYPILEMGMEYYTTV